MVETSNVDYYDHILDDYKQLDIFLLKDSAGIFLYIGICHMMTGLFMQLL